MKRLIALSLLLIIVPTWVMAFSPATLYKGSARKVVTNQTQAKNLFGLGYKLETNGLVGLAAPSVANIKWVQNQPSTLYGSGAILGATTITLKSLKNIDGSLLTMANFGTQGFGTIEPGVSNEEQITFTGVTQNANGTATLTGVKRVLNIYPYTETSGTAVTHVGGTKFVLSNTAGFYNTFANKENNETIDGLYTFGQIPKAPTTTPTDPTQLVTLYQFQQATSTGGVNGSELVKGVFQTATQAQAASRTATGSTGARLMIPASMASSTSSATTTVPVTNTSGKLDTSFIDQTASYNWSGVNTWTGSSTFSGTTTVAGLLNINGTTTFSGSVTGITATSGVIADLATTSTINRDITITLGFKPKTIKLYYYMQGWDGAGSTGYTGMKGIATYNSTILANNFIIFNASSNTNKMTGDDGTPNALTAFVDTPNDTNSPTATGAGGVTATLSILSISSTGFVVREAITGDASHTARAKVGYEAFTQ